MQELSRRNFLAGAGVSAAVLAGEASAAFADEPAKGGNAPDSYDYECDVLVIGAGGAGLAVAYKSAEAGADTLVLESQDTSFASTTYYCYGNYIVCDSDEQRELGIEDTPEKVLEDVMNRGGANPTPSERVLLNKNVVLDFAKHTRETYEIFKGWGVDFSKISDQTGNTTMRCHQIDNRHMMEVLYDNTVAVGAQIMFNTRMTKLIVDGGGMVLGCFATAEDGTEIAVKGKKATVLATGPLVRNQELMEDALPGASKVDVVSGLGANGDGHIAAMELGGALWGRNTIYTCEHYMPGTEALIGTELNQYGAISVDWHGNRIYDDGSQWNNKRTRLLLENGINPDTGTYFTWSIIDQEMYDLAMTTGNPNHGLSDAKVEYLVKGDTIEELAEAIGAPDLPATVAKYNEDLANGGDTVFGRIYRNGPGTGDPLPLETAPFYAWPCKPCWYYAPCFSLMCDDEMQILDGFGDPIGGGRLFGVGEIVDRTVEGNEYLVGSSISFGETIGMQVGIKAAAMDNWDA